ncbi:MAG: hypothetical protein LCH67_14025 [Bacteroidetes bacterium]|nr:hypothetical protein [Bacteroidota bacterium]
MLTTVQGIYENGKLELTEAPPTLEKSKVLVVFLEKEKEVAEVKSRIPGSLKRMGANLKKKFDIPADFNDPLEDMKEYM